MSDTLKQKIKVQLEQTLFTGRIPDRSNLDKEKLKEIVSDFHKSFLTPTLIEEIINDFAFEDVLDKVKSDDASKDTKKFSELEKVNADEVTDKIYTFVSSLPNDYIFIFKLPQSSLPIEKVTLAKNIELLSLTAENINKYIKQEDLRQRLALSMISQYMRGEPELKEGDVILTISGKGYVGKYGAIKMFDLVDPLYTCKVILGIYIALGIIARKEKPEGLLSTSTYKYSIYDDTKTVVRTINESTEDTEYLARMEFNNDKFKLTELEELVKKETTAFEDVNKIVMNALYALKPKGNTAAIKHQRKLKNGAYWLYESLKTSQEHVRTVYCTTAYDAVLDIKAPDDKKEYKAELVATAIAKNVLDAETIRHYIVELYNYRNKIIHGEQSISSLEKYNDLADNPAQTATYMGLSYLTTFFANRAIFINNGLSILTGIK